MSKMDYIFNVNNGLSEANYKSLDLELNVNKFVTSFEYLDDLRLNTSTKTPIPKKIMIIILRKNFSFQF